MDPAPREYELGDEVGRGALARVVRVRRSDGELLAGKILHTSRAQDAAAVERFEREAELVAPLRHPNIARVDGFVTIDGHEVLLMELVEGPTLAEVIATDAPLTLERIVAIGRAIAGGLAAAHAQGVVHRDLKPANILMADGEIPKIADFGMARGSSLEGVDPSAFTVLGTPDYMAPESLDPLAVDARSDLYALGCILYELATGAPPYGGATVFATMEAHRRAPIPRLGDAHPAGLRTLVEALLAKAPADRPQSAEAVAHRLAALVEPTAMAVVQMHAAVVVSKCASCGAPLVAALSVCLSCSLPTPRLEPGEHTLFVTGPGGNAEKLDAELRQRLLDWVGNNPTLGLDVRTLSKVIPRLPFVLVTAISEHSAGALSASLRQLGIESVVQRGGVYSLPAIKKKARTMAGRTFAIVAASTAWVVNSGWWMVFVWAIMWVVVPVVAGVRTLRAMARPTRSSAPALPEGIRARLTAIERTGAQLRARRHREQLRGVVGSALALREAVGDDGSDHEIEEALDVALVAAGRMDELDQTLEAADLKQADAQVRAVLSERDRWSSRILDLHATIEMLRARVASAAARRGQADDVESLDVLRAKVEALEEVQST